MPAVTEAQGAPTTTAPATNNNNSSNNNTAPAAPALAPSAPPDVTRDSTSRLSYVPRDARLMALILHSMGIEDVQPPALVMLLEFAHRYIFEVLQDALVYADHANSAKSSAPGVSALTTDDVQLAVQSRVNHSLTSAPGKDMLLNLASTLNAIPLPAVSDKYGVKLPPAQHCLTNVNFAIVPNPLPDDVLDEDVDEEEDAAGEEENNSAAEGQQSTAQQLADDEDSFAVEDASRADEEMAEASPQEARGVKRSLDEDEDYD